MEARRRGECAAQHSTVSSGVQKAQPSGRRLMEGLAVTALGSSSHFAAHEETTSRLFLPSLLRRPSTAALHSSIEMASTSNRKA
jgi:hypothetical protein